MMNPNDLYQSPPRRRSGFPVTIAVGFGVILVGGALAFGYGQWQAQKAQLAQMAQILEEMQTANQNEAVTRNAPVEFTTTFVPTPAALPVPALPVAAPEPEKVAIAPTPVLPNATPLETLSFAIQGVENLIAAAAAGEYLVTVQGDEENGRLRIVFPNHVEDQARLEQVLASAATAGTLPNDEAVKGSDGTFDGRTILFHLMETALLGGTEAERLVGIQIRLKAISILSTQTTLTTTENASGERLYTVQSGDSLADIALQFFGNTNDYRKIFYANSDNISSPEDLQVGQQIRIPAI